MKKSIRHVLKLALFTSGLSSLFANAELPSYLNLDLDNTTVSGLSSGGYMATQFHLAHADWVTGVGIIGGGPYYCAENNLMTALGRCVNKLDGEMPLDALDEYVQTKQNSGQLASNEALKQGKAWLLHGTLDAKVIAGVSDALAQQYTDWLGEDNVRYVNDKSFSHHFPTLSDGIDCNKSETPFIGNCDYDGAGEMLSFLIPKLKTPEAEAEGTLLTIPQFEQGGSDYSMAEDAFLYVPKACAAGQACKIHISFHGCNQFSGAADVEDKYARLTGFNRWADANNMVVLYPQTTSSMMSPFNPQGCWDWWGYTDKNYATKEGKQIQVVHSLVQRLARNM